MLEVVNIRFKLLVHLLFIIIIIIIIYSDNFKPLILLATNISAWKIYIHFLIS